MSTTGRWDDLFGQGRKWRVLEEATGTVTQGGAVVEFTRGRFEVRTPGWAYASPLSTNLALRGVVLQRTDESGEHDIPGERIAVGAPAVRKARAEYGAVW
jgi:hypothetical protein